MSQVSKRKIQPEIELRIYETLWEAFSKLNSSSEIKSFLGDLLSPIEKIMIAKRLAIAALLSRKYDYENIKDLLKVSSATISKVSITLNFNKGYRLAIEKVARSEATREFWQDIESLLYRLSSTKNVFIPEGFIKKKLNHKRKNPCIISNYFNDLNH